MNITNENKLKKGQLYDIIKDDLIIYCQALYSGKESAKDNYNFLMPNIYDKNIHLTKINIKQDENLKFFKKSIITFGEIKNKCIIHFAGNHQKSVYDYLKKNEYYINNLPRCTQKIFLLKGIQKALYHKC
ncbi:hypothetical protein HN415_07140 [Candidatus Woesearchaeota archaeon]|jgi:hypothetical protein|nr:hypothetical protein [Candidatus Woesearchaeota archaeon]